MSIPLQVKKSGFISETSSIDAETQWGILVAYCAVPHQSQVDVGDLFKVSSSSVARVVHKAVKVGIMSRIDRELLPGLMPEGVPVAAPKEGPGLFDPASVTIGDNKGLADDVEMFTRKALHALNNRNLADEKTKTLVETVTKFIEKMRLLRDESTANQVHTNKNLVDHMNHMESMSLDDQLALADNDKLQTEFAEAIVEGEIDKSMGPGE